MDAKTYCLYVLVMAGVTYLIRAIPLALFQRKLRSPFIRSFLYYVPYAVLGAMTFPDVFTSAGAPAPEAPATFTDLTQDWYRDAVAWAEDNGVINGVGDGKFDPLGSVTREQLVTILHRMAGAPSGMETMLASVYDGQYPDSGEIGGWARAALYWSLYQGIYCGEASVDVGGTLAPRAPASRGQIAVMMVRYLGGQ